MNPTPTPAPTEESASKTADHELFLHRRIGEQQDEIFRLRQEKEFRDKITVEFGDGTVTFRDGAGKIVGRGGLGCNPSWTKLLGNIMARRGATFVAVAMSEHARYSIRAARKEYETENPGCLGSPFLDETLNQPRSEEV